MLPTKMWTPKFSSQKARFWHVPGRWLSSVKTLLPFCTRHYYLFVLITETRMRTYTEQLSFIPGWLEFALTLITLLIFYFYLDFISHSTREESVPVKVFLKVRNTQSEKSAVVFRRDQVNFLVYGSDRPYFKQNQKNNITKFWLTGFF